MTSRPEPPDRLPPHSIEAEQGVLGCILLDSEAAMPEVLDARARSDWFYDLRHQTIFDAMMELHARSVPIDTITLPGALKDCGDLETVGGLSYISSLPDAVPSAHNVSAYLLDLKEKWQLRSIIRAGAGMVESAYTPADPVPQILDAAERAVLAVRAQTDSGKTLTARELVHAAIATLEEMHARQGAPDGLPTGFSDLDRMTGGMHGGELIIIAGRPSFGKTSLGMNIAEHVALVEKQPVGVFSLEMTAKSLMLRLMASNARVNIRNIRDGFMAERDIPRLTVAGAKLASAPLHIDDTGGLTVLQLRSRARRMWQQSGIKLLVVDYLQLLSATRQRNDTRSNEISEISGGLKNLAKELGIPVIALSQLNRDIEKEKNRKPRMSDIRDGGSVEQDADLVATLYRPDTEADSDSVAVTLAILKQRNGPTGDVHLTFLKSFTRFESASKVSGEDYKSPYPD